jgi:hypothetical protein
MSVLAFGSWKIEKYGLTRSTDESVALMESIGAIPVAEVPRPVAPEDVSGAFAGA